MSDLENPSRADPARRRLVRGAFAAPAVMTVFSGRALAQTSATCFAKNAATTVDPTTSSATTDIWFRVRVRKIGTGSNPLNNYVKLSEVAYSLQLSVTPFTYGGASYVRLNRDDNYAMYSDQTAPSSTDPSTFRNKWVLLRFNEEAKVVGFGGVVGSSGSPMSTSCWTSFLA